MTRARNIVGRKTGRPAGSGRKGTEVKNLRLPTKMWDHLMKLAHADGDNRNHFMLTLIRSHPAYVASGGV